jgi:REP element-mobilizing transposase RayT
VISRIVGQQFLINEEAKDYFLAHLKRCCSAYFVKLHSFCILDNHFHLLVTVRESLANGAEAEELLSRYKMLHEGRHLPQGLAENLSIEGLRNRFGDISRFVQDVKQGFSRWYNWRYKRKGYLWGDRFKGILVSRGRAQLDVAAYIELNCVRAGLCSSPLDYRWCSMGCDDSSFIFTPDTMEFEGDVSSEVFQDYVFECGGIQKSVDEESGDMTEKTNMHDSPDYCSRVKNYSYGVVVGGRKFVEKVQEELGRVYQTGRGLFPDIGIFTTRKLRM